MKKLLYGIALCLFATHVQAAGTRNLMLLLDWDSETMQGREGFGPVTQIMLAAIKQQPGPFIVSSQTLRNALERGSRRGVDGHEPCRAFFYAPKPIFNYNNWIVKKLSDYFYLFIPKSYLAAIQARKDTPTDARNMVTPLTQQERELGMKFSKFPDITPQNLLSPQYHKQNISLNNYQSLVRKNALMPLQQMIRSRNEETAELYFFGQHLLSLLDKVLVTRSDLMPQIDRRRDPALFKQEAEANEALFLHEWLVYIDGHGSPATQGPVMPVVTQRKGYVDINQTDASAGLEHNAFQSVLKFFNNRVNTGSLVYTTCYSGGPHLFKLFESQWDAFLRRPQLQTKKESYNYLIIVTNIWSTATAASVLSEYDDDRGGYGVEFMVKFPEFFKSLSMFLHPAPKKPLLKYVKGKAPRPVRKGARRDITKELSSLLRLIHEFNPKNRYQMPGIRFPYTEWFVAIDDPTLPIAFDQSQGKMGQSKKRLVQERRTAALDAAIKKKLAQQKQLKATKQEHPLAAASQARAKELEAVRLREEAAKERQLYSGIMKLQKQQTDKLPPLPAQMPSGFKPPVMPVAQQPKIPAGFKQQATPTQILPGVQAQPVSTRLGNALAQLQDALRQLENSLYQTPVYTQGPGTQGYSYPEGQDYQSPESYSGDEDEGYGYYDEDEGSYYDDDEGSYSDDD